MSLLSRCLALYTVLFCSRLLFSLANYILFLEFFESQPAVFLKLFFFWPNLSLEFLIKVVLIKKTCSAIAILLMAVEKVYKCLKYENPHIHRCVEYR